MPAISTHPRSESATSQRGGKPRCEGSSSCPRSSSSRSRSSHCLKRTSSSRTSSSSTSSERLLCRYGLSPRSEEHTSELQSQFHLVCRLLLEKKNTFLLWY